jgi:hypothetical protein
VLRAWLLLLKKRFSSTVPGHSKRIHNAFEDPAALQGGEEERLAIFRRVRNEIRDYLKTFPENVR